MATVTAALLLLVGSSGTASAWGDKCKDVTIKVTNKTGFQVQLAGTWHYYDYAKKKWRKEIVNVVGRMEVKRDESRTWKRNLEYVKNDNTRLKIKFWWRAASGNYWSESYYEGPKQRCKSGGRFDAVITSVPIP